MPKKIDRAVRERAVRLVREHRAEYSSLTAAAEAVARRERLGKETVRRWVLLAEIDPGERPGGEVCGERGDQGVEGEGASARGGQRHRQGGGGFFAGELDPGNR
jgi:transposase